ncbi:haloalkane dehalogenase [Pseudoalteromonas sp. S3178]|uniref:haloalkane dehalogenase n=1 Tax=Pseudoalteromonas sp. S3178 TaxID=579532 RepID=UPI001486D3E1|nr:haloalkane dehalogenase [Pseudoalteromonas sp. S3178]
MKITNLSRLAMAGLILIPTFTINVTAAEIKVESPSSVSAKAQEISADFPFESKYIEVYGSNMHYVDEGTGAPILFLHGNTTSSYLWRNVMPHLSGQGRIIAPDLIGYGKSDKPNLEYRVFDQIKYVEGFIEKLNLNNITLVIHDWGSAIGLHIAMKYPEKIKAIAMMDAHLKPMESWDEFADDEQTIKGFQAFRTPILGWDLVTNKNVFMRELFPSVILRDLKPEEMNTYLAPFPTPESRRPIWRLANDIPMMGQPVDTHKLFATYSDKLTKSDLPKLLIYFEPGLIIRDEQLTWAKTNLKNLTLTKVGNSVHFVQEDDPHGIGEAISNWYQKLKH